VGLFAETKRFHVVIPALLCVLSTPKRQQNELCFFWVGYCMTQARPADLGSGSSAALLNVAKVLLTPLLEQPSFSTCPTSFSAL
jgi:hypothetical protein